MTKHPAEHFIRYLLIRDPAITDGNIQRSLEEWGFLTADPTWLPIVRQELGVVLPNLQLNNRAHRETVRYLRDQQVYEAFHPNDAMAEAWEILGDPEKRRAAETILLARLDLGVAARKVNAKHDWHLTEAGLAMFRHYFWNVPGMTFDEWGRYMYNRTSMYEQYMGLLMASPKLAFYHLRLDQTIESKKMIQRTQEIAYFTLEEVAQKPGTSIDKVKAIKLLGSVVIESHNALSTSDMALKDVLKQFEHWRMEHPQVLPPAMKELAPAGNYSGTGKDRGNVIELPKRED